MKKALFILIHVGAVLVLWTGVSLTAAMVCMFLYLVRMFAITAGYHRYFSHRTFKTSRVFQFILALLGTSAGQKGPLWWAACHRHHHKHADTDEDLHSPGLRGLWWAHAGWVLSCEFDEIDLDSVKDLSQYPELRFLERYHYVPPFLLLGLAYLFGIFLSQFPALHTTPSQIAVVGALISTVFLYHGTFAINSLAHVIGRRRLATEDHSKNSFILALLTLGEGWHNNHHRYPGSERQGFYWWELDISHYVLVLLKKLGVVWDLREPPERIYQEARDLGPAT